MSANPQIEHGHTRIANEILEEIMKVNLNGTQFRLVMAIWRYTYGFQRKQHGMSISFLAKAIDASTTQVERGLKSLIDRKIVTINGKGHRGVNILAFNKKYNEWTDFPPKRGESQPPSKQGEDLPSKVWEDPPSKMRDKKEIYNKENIKENIYVQVIGYLNEKAGKRFSPKSKANQKLINGRLAEGRTLEDFLYVIDVKCDHWLDDPKMNEYLRPATLFAQKNFENYINQKPKNRQKQNDPRDKEIEFQRWVNAGNDPDEFDWS